MTSDVFVPSRDFYMTSDVFAPQYRRYMTSDVFVLSIDVTKSDMLVPIHVQYILCSS